MLSRLQQKRLLCNIENRNLSMFQLLTEVLKVLGNFACKCGLVTRTKTNCEHVQRTSRHCVCSHLLLLLLHRTLKQLIHHPIQQTLHAYQRRCTQSRCTQSARLCCQMCMCCFRRFANYTRQNGACSMQGLPCACCTGRSQVAARLISIALLGTWLLSVPRF